MLETSTDVLPLRRAFNAAWTAEAYEAYKARLASAVGAPIPFRVCENCSPVDESSPAAVAEA